MTKDLSAAQAQDAPSQASDQLPEPGPIDIVFDGPPGPVAGRFVKVESPPGRGTCFGEWVERPDGYWALRIPQAPMDAATIAARLATACAALRAKGYDRPEVVLVMCGEAERFARGPWAVLRVGDAKASFQNGYEHPTIEAALAEIDAAVDRATHKWTAADVAATLGLTPDGKLIELCSSCEERPATHDLHDDTYLELTGPSPRVCEPCLEREADRQAQRQSEDAA